LKAVEFKLNFNIALDLVLKQSVVLGGCKKKIFQKLIGLEKPAIEDESSVVNDYLGLKPLKF